MPTLKQYQRRVSRDGVLSLSSIDDLKEYFDLQARRLVGLSGKEALKRIQIGSVGTDLGWTSLSLLAALFPKVKSNGR